MFRFAHDDDEFDVDDEDGEDGPMWRRRRRRPPADPTRFPKVPSDEGTELMNSGTFGSNEEESVNLSERGSIGKKKKLARRILDRELATDSHAKQRLNQRLMAQVKIERPVFKTTTNKLPGHDTGFKSGHGHPLQSACLLRPVFG